MVKQKEAFKEVMDKVWPRTKKELEKGIDKAKKMLNKGEQYLKEVSERGAAKTKKLSLSLKREKLCYDLGKILAKTQTTKWQSNHKVTAILKQIKTLDKQIQKIK